MSSESPVILFPKSEYIVRTNKLYKLFCALTILLAFGLVAGFVVIIVGLVYFLQTTRKGDDVLINTMKGSFCDLRNVALRAMNGLANVLVYDAAKEFVEATNGLLSRISGSDSDSCKPTIVSELDVAIKDADNLMYTTWIAAGKPTMPVITWKPTDGKGSVNVCTGDKNGGSCGANTTANPCGLRLGAP